MIQVFCDQRGAGKTKALIKMANGKVINSKGNVVYIDDDKRVMFELHRNIRFISTDDYALESYKSFYGFMCGILASDYDIDAIFIDGLFNIVNLDKQNAAHLFYGLEKLNENCNVDFYMSVNEEEEIPECMKKYMDLVCV